MPIAQSLGVTENGFIKVVAAFSPLLPYGLLALFGGMTLVEGVKKFPQGIGRYFFMILSFGTAFVALYMGQDEIISRDGLNIENGYYISVPIALIIDGIAYYLGMKMTAKIKDPMLLEKLMGVILIAVITIGFTTASKVFLFHRPRYVYLINGKTPFTVSDFIPVFRSSPYYKDVKDLVPSDVFKSFPSGHAAALGMLIPFSVFFASLNEKTKKIWYVFGTVAFILAIITAVSRLMAGSHFLTDVAFGLFVPVFTATAE